MNIWRAGKTIPLERTMCNPFSQGILAVIFLNDYFVLIVSVSLIKVPWKIKGNLVNKMAKCWMDQGWSPAEF